MLKFKIRRVNNHKSFDLLLRDLLESWLVMRAHYHGRHS